MDQREGPRGSRCLKHVSGITSSMAVVGGDIESVSNDPSIVVPSLTILGQPGKLKWGHIDSMDHPSMALSIYNGTVAWLMSCETCVFTVGRQDITH